jgi:peptide/nickel transport system substrate-binding protein
MCEARNVCCVPVIAAVAGIAVGPTTYAGGFTCPKIAQRLVFAQEAEPTSMDMHFPTAVSTREITMNFMAVLITRAENNDVIPMLADSWSESPDHPTYMFKLRMGEGLYGTISRQSHCSKH